MCSSMARSNPLIRYNYMQIKQIILLLIIEEIIHVVYQVQQLANKN